MSLAVKFNSELGIVESEFSDLVTDEELEAEAVQSIALARENGTNLYLSDATQATFRVAIASVFDLPAVHDDHKLARPVRIAVLPPASEEGKEVVKFYETVCVNRGWSVKLFSDRNEALEWLLQSKDGAE